MFFIRTLVSFAVAFLIFGISGVAAAEPVSVRAVLEKSRAVVGEPVVLQIQVEGSDRPGKPRLERLRGFSAEYLGGQNRSNSSITIINGKVSKVEFRGYVFSYRLTPLRTGRLRIGPVEVPVDSAVLRTQPLALEVVEAKPTDDFLLRVEFSKTELYVGEPVTLTVAWYLGKDVEDFGFNLPLLESPALAIQDPEVSQEPGKQYYSLPVGGGKATAEKSTEFVNGRRYTTLTFQKIATPLKPGRLALPESTVSCKAVEGYTNSRRSPLDGFLDDDFFGFGRRRVLETHVATAGPVTLNVLPLPEKGKPPGFAGLVGKYRVGASADPVKVRVGDPITLEVAVRGPEILDGVELPPLGQDPRWTHQFKIPEEMAAGIAKNGAKVFSQTIRVKDPSVKEIPPVELPYFDPEAREYRVARSDPIPLRVEAARVFTADDVEGAGSLQPVQNELTALSRGIAHNYEGYDALTRRPFTLARAARSPLWIAVFTIPVLAYMAICAFVMASRRSDPDRHRSRKALSRFKKAMRELRRCGDGHEVHAHLLDSMRRYLGDKLRMNGEALTFADIEGRLKQLGVEEPDFRKLEEIFNLCEQGRYGGKAPGALSGEALARRAADIMEGLDRKI